MGGGVVDGLFDSIDIDPRVRFGVRFGTSAATTLLINFFSISFGVCGLVFVLLCGVAALTAKRESKTKNAERVNQIQSCGDGQWQYQMS